MKECIDPKQMTIEEFSIYVEDKHKRRFINACRFMEMEFLEELLISYPRKFLKIRNTGYKTFLAVFKGLSKINFLIKDEYKFLVFISHTYMPLNHRESEEIKKIIKKIKKNHLFSQI